MSLPGVTHRGHAPRKLTGCHPEVDAAPVPCAWASFACRRNGVRVTRRFSRQGLGAGLVLSCHKASLSVRLLDPLVQSCSKCQCLFRNSEAQFSLWALMPAPLMLGANVLELSPYDALTYSNLEVPLSFFSWLRGFGGEDFLHWTDLGGTNTSPESRAFGHLLSLSTADLFLPDSSSRGGH